MIGRRTCRTLSPLIITITRPQPLASLRRERREVLPDNEGNRGVDSRIRSAVLETPREQALSAVFPPVKIKAPSKRNRSGEISSRFGEKGIVLVKSRPIWRKDLSSVQRSACNSKSLVAATPIRQPALSLVHSTISTRRSDPRLAEPPPSPARRRRPALAPAGSMPPHTLLR